MERPLEVGTLQLLVHEFMQQGNTDLLLLYQRAETK